MYITIDCRLFLYSQSASLPELVTIRYTLSTYLRDQPISCAIGRSFVGAIRRRMAFTSTWADSKNHYSWSTSCISMFDSIRSFWNNVRIPYVVGKSSVRTVRTVAPCCICSREA